MIINAFLGVIAFFGFIALGLYCGYCGGHSVETTAAASTPAPTEHAPVPACSFSHNLRSIFCPGDNGHTCFVCYDSPDGPIECWPFDSRHCEP